MTASPMDLLAAPELAVLDALDAVLEAATAALIAAHLAEIHPSAEPETPRGLDQPEPAAASVARAILALERSLRAQLAAYRNALAIDRERERRREVAF